MISSDQSRAARQELELAGHFGPYSFPRLCCLEPFMLEAAIRAAGVHLPYVSPYDAQTPLHDETLRRLLYASLLLAILTDLELA